MKAFLCGATALAALGALPQSASSADPRPLVTTQPDPQTDVAPYFVADSDPRWSSADWSAADIAALREKIKYVFVIFNENRSFDHEYGTFPGVERPLFRRPETTVAGGHAGLHPDLPRQVTGKTVTVQPFLVGPAQNASFKDSTDHSHKGLAAKIDVADEGRRPTAKMDKFAEVEWRRYASTGGEKGEKQGTQFARLVMAHVDCDTIPFFWRYASRFTIFDNIFATEDTPSTPNAVAMIAGQSGETQWVKHPASPSNPAATGFTGAIAGTINGKSYSGVGDDRGPAAGQRPATVVGLRIRQRDRRRPPADRAGRELGSEQHRLQPHLRLAPADDDGRLDRLVHGPGPQSGIRPRRREEGHPRHRSGRGGRPSPGAGTRTATISSRLTRRASRRISAMSATTTARNISAMSPTIRSSRPTCAAKATSSPTSRKARCRQPAGSSISAAAITTSISEETRPSSRTRTIPNPKGLTPGRTRQDHPFEVGRRRPSELFRQPADRGDGRARHQRDRGEQGHLGEERDHHHL